MTIDAQKAGSEDAARSRPFRIVAWPRRSPTNRYTGALYDTIASRRGVEVTDLSMGLKMPARAAARRFDILHIHWLERAFWAPDRRRVLRQVAQVALVTLLLKARGARLVWTAHDPSPHAADINTALTQGWTARLWRAYRAMMIKRIDGVLLLSESHRASLIAATPALADVPMAVVPHPHYLGQYLDTIGREAARLRMHLAPDTPVFAFVGSLRAYKNPDGLLRAFAKLDEPAALLIAGAPENSVQAAELTALAAADPRVRLHLGFVPDDALQHWLRAADIAVLPYRRVTNSGSAHLALSFDLPVLVPDEPVFRELEAMVGPDWVMRFPDALDEEDLARAIKQLRHPRPTRPDLSALDWSTIADRTLAFFRRVAA